MRLHLLLLILLCSGCIPTKQITPTTGEGSFILKEDILEFHKGGFGDLYLSGLIKGEYIAIVHDKSGIYYRGPRRCLVLLDEEQGRHFLATGEHPSAIEDPNKTNVLTGDEGGVYVPYNMDEETPWYFYYGDYRHVTGDTDSKIPPLPKSDINAPTPETIPAAARSERNSLYFNNQTSYGSASPSDVAMGNAIGAAIGRQWGLSGLRDAQGGIIQGGNVRSKKILEIIRAARAARMPTNR